MLHSCEPTTVHETIQNGKKIYVAAAITLQHGSVNSASMLTKGNLAIGVILSLKWHNQKEHPSTCHLSRGKEEHELNMQVTEGYITGTSTMQVRVTTKGQKVLVISIGDNYHLLFGS